MHRVITAAPQGVSVDHQNGNGLDNCRSNLRVAGQSKNVAAAQIHRGKSLYRGVQWSSQKGRWHAQIKVNYQKKHLGTFTDPVDAAHAYDQAALVAFGEYANLNFPEESCG